MLKTTTSSPTDAKKTSKAPGNSKFLRPKAKLVFLRLRQAFTKAPILNHFDPECYIWIETDASGYTIGGILSQLILDSSQWYLVAFYFRKMILAKIQYEIHDQELLAIVEAFNSWRHYLEGYKFEVFVLTVDNNHRQFIDIKSLSSRQVWWVQEISRYYFWINYHQGKANAAADAFSHFP